ncbi:MAG: hypothetical protein E7198_00665 [Schwartzia succinivorans]|uniref:Eco57I restriction-modification methylase domain-containing protein n=1 Tax=Schwartzia succinivorans TaxID=55507 RepID=UPI0023536882|nr:Eco57I restriction-modification methylase domain-containing protein [Schwartzia succinivorans]MBE6096293.1 hypothetical protein [Schwartzia succinivorans]
MKFDFVIGNPPYQEESEIKSKTNGQAPRKNIFQYFQIEADEIAGKSSVLIYPGVRWMHQSGKGLKQFGKDLINDHRLSTVEFFPDAKDLFGTAADLADGITIVTKKQNKKSDGFKYIYSRNGNKQEVSANNPGDELFPLNPNDFLITKKIRAFVRKYHLGYLHDAILPRSLFGVESDFVQKYPHAVRVYTESEKINYDKEIKLLTNDRAGKAGRAKWYVADRKVIKHNVKFIDEYQVVVSSANAGGQKRDNQIEIIDNHSAYGRSRVALRSFKTYDEAKNFYNYAKTYLIRYAFLMSDEALSSVGLLVPDIMDYSNKNKILDFNKDVDKQFFDMIKLSDEEVLYIKDIVNNSRGGK